ncbi:MAG: hypothetical protein H6717_03240 [Polyangiaceae bacterium]|nr:hypothetical protein [Polyangiaceae bacterium]
MKVGYVLAGAVVLAAVIGATVRQQPSVTPETQAATPANATQAPPLTGTEQTLPPNHPPIPDDPGSMQQAPSAKADLAGEVKEAINVSSYTYLRIQTDSGEVWAAVPTAEMKAGDQAKVVGAMEMKNFTSPTLKRTFDSIYFGTLQQQQAASPHAK